MSGPPTIEVEVEGAESSTLTAVFTLADLDAEEFPPVRWVVPNVLPEGTILFAGKPKMGKSWFAMGIGIAVATGGVALGNVRVEKGEILYLALEDNRRRLKRRAKKLTGGDPLPANFHAATGWPRANEGGAENLRAWLTDHPGARLVIIDTLAKFRPQSKKNGDRYGEDYDATKELLHLAAEFNVCILIVHHLRKSEAEGDVMDEISGSTGLTGGVDGMMVIKRQRGQADAVLHIDGRDIEDAAELALRFDGLTAQWVLLGDAAQVAMEEGRRTILEALDHIGPATIVELADHLERLKKTVETQVNRMLKDKQIRIAGKKGKANTFAPIPPEGAEGVEGVGSPSSPSRPTSPSPPSPHSPLEEEQEVREWMEAAGEDPEDIEKEIQRALDDPRVMKGYVQMARQTNR